MVKVKLSDGPVEVHATKKGDTFSVDIKKDGKVIGDGIYHNVFGLQDVKGPFSENDIQKIERAIKKM